MLTLTNRLIAPYDDLLTVTQRCRLQRLHWLCRHPHGSPGHRAVVRALDAGLGLVSEKCPGEPHTNRAVVNDVAAGRQRTVDP